jgi:hypothetical protein
MVRHSSGVVPERDRSRSRSITVMMATSVILSTDGNALLSPRSRASLSCPTMAYLENI